MSPASRHAHARSNIAAATANCRYGLTPEAFVSSRVVRHNFGFLKAVPRSLPLHTFAKTRVAENGVEYANGIVRLLMAKGESVESVRLPPSDPRACVVRELPVERSARYVTFRFVRTHLPVPRPDSKTQVAICCDPPEGGDPVPLTAAGDPSTIFVPRSHVVATLRVDLPPLASVDAGACVLQFHFGNTEIEAVVTVLATGAQHPCSIRYLDDRPLVADGAVAAAGEVDDGEDPVR